MLDALKNLMSTMTDIITQQVIEQVKKAIEAANSARPLPHFDYVPTTGCEPFHRHVPVVSHHHSDKVREIARLDRDGQSQGEIRDCSIAADVLQSRHPSQGRPAKSTMALMPYAMHSRCTAWNKPRGPEGRPQRPQPMTSAPKLHNVRKYCEFHEQNEHATAKCRELMKALHELIDKGWIDYFLKKGPRFL
ncbi:hypothetical protein Cgig2_010951 [Carnegiea gigantea]|uniref:Uncharacterized protein n=1 Tax=Carnegiea gigantea TaxID=171969 RepID=A0A9Q1K0L3_9CARY|nr:hypothetical protein Cgig2_010951 [Carnegiea gigantea]